MRRSTTAMIALLLGTAHCAAADMGPFQGEWVGEGQDCSILETYEHEAMLRIKSDTIGMYEGECVIRRAKRDGTRVEASLLCESEGETFRDDFVAKLTGKDTMSVKDGFDYVRCP